MNRFLGGMNNRTGITRVSNKARTGKTDNPFTRGVNNGTGGS